MSEKKIGGRTFRCEPLLARDAIVLQARLIKFLGAGIDRLPQIFGGMSAKATPEEKEKANASAIRAITEIFGKAEPDQVADLASDIVRIAQIVRPSGAYDPCDLDGDFSGRDMKDLFPVITFVLQEQFGDFFGGADAAGNRVARAKAH